MSTVQVRRYIPLLAAALTLLQGCAGGQQVAGIDRGGAAVATTGVVTGFGSVFVNGVEFETEGATIDINGQSGTQANLRVGQVVSINGTLDEGSTTHGTAQTVTFEAEVRGPVASIDTASATFVVLGQTVRVTETTSFDDGISPRDITGLAVNDFVEISGFRNASGEVVATRIDLEDSTGAEVTGTVSGLDSTAQTFLVNALEVDYSTATLDGFNGASLANGDRVEVRGDTFTPGGQLVATRVKLESEEIDGNAERVEVEGIVTRFVSASDFDVNGHRVSADSATRYDGGTAADLALNAAVEIEGSPDGSGGIQADEIKFRGESDLETSGTVTAVDAAGNTLTVAGVAVIVNSTTRFEDHSAADIPNFSLADVQVGDFIQVRGYETADGFVATRLERDDAEADVEIRGAVSAVDAPQFTVLGITVITDANTEFKDADGTEVNATDFFAVLATGDNVRVKGQQTGDTVQAAEVEIKQ